MNLSRQPTAVPVRRTLSALNTAFIKPVRTTTWFIIALLISLVAVLVVGNLMTKRTDLRPYVKDHRGSSALPESCSVRSGVSSRPLSNGATFALETPSGERISSTLNYYGSVAFLDHCSYSTLLEDVPVESGSYTVFIDGQLAATVDDDALRDEYLTFEVG